MENTNLKWVQWEGKLPPYAVSIYNSKEGRTDYVAKCDWKKGGFYTPSKGSYCYFPWAGIEDKFSQFEILVNEGNLENLEWKAGSYGKVPQNSVQVYGSAIYVGKNECGLGKVDVKNEAFFLPREGKETWHKHYEVLTYDTDISSQRITNVIYDTKQAKIVNYPPETMSRSSTSNNTCTTVTKTVQLQKTQQVEKRWDTSSSIKLGVTTTMTAGIPDVASVGVQFSAETTFTLSRGTTVTDAKSHSFSVAVSVPPNRLCSVCMVGNRSSAEIPYTARVTRRYSNGVIRSADISGTYKGVDTYEVHTVVDPFTPI